MAFAAYAALREKVTELPALPSREECKDAVELINACVRGQPIWSEAAGFNDDWRAVGAALADQRFDLKIAGKTWRSVQIDENVVEALEALIADAPTLIRNNLLVGVVRMRMPIDRWIQLVRIAEDLYAELALNAAAPAPSPAESSSAASPAAAAPASAPAARRPERDRAPAESAPAPDRPAAPARPSAAPSPDR
jgi:hypothetical protein